MSTTEIDLDQLFLCLSQREMNNLMDLFGFPSLADCERYTANLANNNDVGGPSSWDTQGDACLDNFGAFTPAENPTPKQTFSQHSGEAEPYLLTPLSSSSAVAPSPRPIRPLPARSSKVDAPKTDQTAGFDHPRHEGMVAASVFPGALIHAPNATTSPLPTRGRRTIKRAVPLTTPAKGRTIKLSRAEAAASVESWKANPHNAVALLDEAVIELYGVHGGRVRDEPLPKRTKK